jgi:hypothetical protein
MLKTKIGLISALSCALSAQAGTLGEVSEALPSSYVFLAAEGGWTWNKLGGLDVNIPSVGRIFTDKEVSRGSGRLSMGAQKYLCPAIAAIGEIGYGYYGKTNFNFHQYGPILSTADAPDFSQVHVHIKNDGFDVLGGVSYDFLSRFDVFFKAGAMIENTRTNATIDFSRLAPGAVFGSASLDIDRTQVFPEIKLGGEYKFCRNLLLTAAWMHVFGEAPHIDLYINVNAPPGTLVIDRENPTIDTFFLGLKWAIPA